MKITCQDVWNDISDYVDNEIGRRQRDAIAQHLEQCRRCTALRDAILNIIALYRDDRLLAPSADFHEQVCGKLEKTKINPAAFLSPSPCNPEAKS